MNALRLLSIATAGSMVLLLAMLAWYGANPIGYWTFEAARDVFFHLLGVALIAGALRIWMPARAVILLSAIASLYLAGGLGILQCAAALLLVASSLVLGRRLLAFMFPTQPATATAATFCGLALYLAILGIMIHFPVNYRAVYFVLLLAPLIAGRGGPSLLGRELAAQVDTFRIAAERLPYFLFTAAVAGVVLLARLGFLPTVGFDDNTLHLRLWSQLRDTHVHGFDYIAHVWEVAPFLVDLLHACVNLIAGADARGATNVVLLAILLRQLWVALGIFELDTAARILLITLFASTPLNGALLLSMHTELFMAVLAMAGVRLVLELRGNWCSPHTAALLAIAALCCATKLPGAVLGLALVAAAALQLWFTRIDTEHADGRSIALLLTFTAVLATAAFNPYVTAWLLTGNPVFPLYNGIFRSPYFDAYNFVDDRWLKGFNFTNYWDLFFNTSAYMEARNFSAGFQYLLLFPLGLIALLSIRGLRRQAAPLLVPLLGFGLVMFAATQYWRYEFPVMPLAVLAIGALLAPAYPGRGALAVQVALLSCIALNLLFFPGTNDFIASAPGRIYSADAKQELLERFVAPRALTAWVNANAPGSTVFYPGTPFGATLHGTPVYVNWYSPTNAAAFSTVRDEADGMAFLRDRQIDYVIARIDDPGLPGTLAWELRRFLSRVGMPVLLVSDHILYRIDGTDVPYKPFFRLNERFDVDAVPRMVGSIKTGAALAMRYSVEFACADAAGYFVAQINWNNGEYYYHPIQCSGDTLQFVEGAPIPSGASAGDVYVAVSETSAATLTQLSIEILE
jgi:hypothetical protein